MDFSKAVYQSKNFTYDIGLVTTWFARNFGAIFTAYALYKYLENAGYSVLMIRKPKELWTDGYNAPERNPIALNLVQGNIKSVKNIRLMLHQILSSLIKVVIHF